MRLLILAALLASAVSVGFGQEVSITESEYQSALSRGYSSADKHPYRRTTVEESFSEGKRTGYEKHTTENLPPDRSRYIYESEYRGQRENKQKITIGDVSFCKEGDGPWEVNVWCDRITGIPGPSVRSREWSRSHATFKNNPVTWIRSYITFSSPRSDASKVERVLFSEDRTFIDMEGKIVFEESTTGIVGSTEIVSRSTTNYEYGLDDLKIEAPIP